MFLASYRFDGKISWGLADVQSETIYPSEKVFGDNAEETLLEYIKESGCSRFEKIDLSKLSGGIPLSQVQLAAPIHDPIRNIFCVGRNYLDHVKELSDFDSNQFEKKHDEIPIFFTKCTTAVNDPYGSIPLHEGVTKEIDYEAELAVIIGKEGINIKEEDACDYIFGYTVLNDCTARDLQRNHKQWVKGKSLDGFCPMGPWIVTRDEVEDIQNLDITSFVNGGIRQSSSTKNMIFPIARLIADLSKGITLKAGDIIATGTPSGVGAGFKPPKFLQKGDVVKVEIEGIGAIENKVG